MNDVPVNTVQCPEAGEAFPARPSAPRRPELLAPAGDWECARAAVENGADAIYFGLENFNARMRARNFTSADLPALMEFLHRRGVRGYVSFNTLVFADELAEAERTLRTIIAAGVDAAIVQDVGVCRLIRRLSPDFPIHASTQLTITSAAGVEFARELGCSLVVLARECSVKEIEAIQAAQAESSTLHPRSSTLLEVFIHGALCVAYSGQCLTSEALGGRSANRGICAQACRMPYELISDGESVALGDRRYLLSPQDLAGIEMLPELIRLGVASLKIEGRLKSPEYVANITRVYRRAIDELVAESGASAAGRAGALKSESRYDLEMAFSRGLYTGWFGGINNQELVHGRFGKKRGVFLGAVTRVERERVFIQLEGPLKPGDGVVFDAARPDLDEEGGRVYEVRSPKSGIQGGGESMLAFGDRDLDFTRIKPGDKLWKTSDPELERRLRQTFEGEAVRFQRPLDIEAHGRVGEPLTLIARDEVGHVVRVESAMPLGTAEKQPLTEARLREQLGRLGGTAFRLGSLHVRLEGDLMLPVSELNRLRRDLVAQLDARRAQPLRWTLGERGTGIAELGTQVKPADAVARDRSGPELIVMVRSLEQLDVAVRAGVSTVYCEFDDPKRYRDAVRRFRELQSHPSANGDVAEQAVPQSAIRNPQSAIFVAPPRITKPGEDWILEQVGSAGADGILVRNFDHLAFFSGTCRIGDYSLNIANALTAEYFLERHRLERVTASYDLNHVQLDALLRSAPPGWFEITIHQHMPLFHMEHCLFCAFLSKGTDFRNCGRPCDKHAVELRDRVGARHPVKADAGCRNTVYNALAQTGAEHVARFVEAGARRFRIEFLNESAEQTGKTIRSYQQLFRGEMGGAQLWRELKLFNQLGVTRGPMG